jgi:hypothetical protein
MGPNKAPNSDGLNAKFIQIHWDVIESRVSNDIKEAFRKARSPAAWSRANIVLLNKCSEPRTPKDYRPFSIGNTLYCLFFC